MLAAGSWTAPLARKLGLSIPMQPGKGYSFLIKPKVMPRHGILFGDIHVGASPLGDRLRLAGTMEFSGYNLEVDRARLENVFRLARQYIEVEQRRIRGAVGRAAADDGGRAAHPRLGADPTATHSSPPATRCWG